MLTGRLHPEIGGHESYLDVIGGQFFRQKSMVEPWQDHLSMRAGIPPVPNDPGRSATPSRFFGRSAWGTCDWGNPRLNCRAAKRCALSSRRNCNVISVEIRCTFLDEPTIGFHPSDVERLVARFDRLVELGNTVSVVEHDLDVVAASDYVIDMGPGAGEAGGEIVVCGTPVKVSTSARSRTALYLKRRFGASN